MGSTLLRGLFMLGAVSLVARVHGQGMAESAPAGAADIASVSPDSIKPRHFGHATCSRVLPGCKLCTMFYVRPHWAKSASTAAATARPDHFFNHYRKVYVCRQCFPGYILTGSSNPNDPQPGICVPTNGGESGTQVVTGTVSSLCITNTFQ